jgi:flagellar biosynthesis protein FlhG
MAAAPPPASPRRSAARNTPRAAPGPIIAVASGKGGVGKTWLSVTLACVFARQARRTLLVDGDLGLANADVQLGVRAQADLAAVQRGWVDLQDAIAPVFGGVGQAGGFDLLAGSSGTGALADLSAADVNLIASGVSSLALQYDRVVFDLAAGVDGGVLRLAETADRLVVVTTEEPTAMADAYALIKLLHKRGKAPLPFIAVNTVEKRLNGRRVYDHLCRVCEQHLKIKPSLAGVIRRDPRVPDCIRAQTPLPMRHPTADVLDDVLSLVEGLALARPGGHAASAGAT